MNNRLIKKIDALRHRIPVLVILCFLVVCASAETLFQSNSPKHPSRARSTKKIELRKADLMTQRTNPDIIVFNNNVVLYHDGALMYCDSAYLDDKNNTFDAFGHVKINQGDTIILTGDYMHYDGMFRLAKVRKNVILEDKKAKTTLFTDSLNYDRMMNIAYYFDGGMIVDPVNELTSTWGQYEPNLKLATFRDSVKLVNKQYTINTDTLQYNTRSSIATILGPAVVLSDSGTIYTNHGWYNTKTEESLLLNQSVVVNKQKNQFLTGDSIHFNRAMSLGDVYGNMILQDTLRKVILKGNRGHYDGRINFSWAADSAQMLEYSQKDTLYMHADTLQMTRDRHGNNLMKAYWNARFFRTDIQGLGDSIQYSTKDSILHMFKDAVAWNSSYQAAGDTIHIFMKDSTVDHMILHINAYIMEQIDSLKFNQMKGKKITAYLQNKQLHYVYVEGNAESIFYPQEKDKSFIGHNQTESGFMSIYFADKKVKRLKLWPEPKAVMTPLPELLPANLKLKNVAWLDYLRPLNKNDIFRKSVRKSTDLPPKRIRYNQDN